MSISTKPFPPLLLVLLLSPLTSAWVATNYYERTVTTEVTGYTNDFATLDPLVRTEDIDVTPTVDQPSAVKTETSVGPYHKDVTYINVLLAPDQAQTLITQTGEQDAGRTAFFVPLTFTYQTCDPPEVTTTGRIHVATAVADAVTPTSTTTSVTSYTLEDSEPTTSTEIRAYLDPSDVPPDALSSVRASYDTGGCRTYDPVDGSHDLDVPAGCSSYRLIAAGKVIGRGYCCSDGSCHSISGLSVPGACMIGISVWFAFFLFVGLVQSLEQFKNLMTGKRARRGLPDGFLCLFPVIACALCFFRNKGFAPKSSEEQAVLERQFAKIPRKTKFTLWLKWGFRSRYPPMLGDPPRRAQTYDTSGPNRYDNNDHALRPVDSQDSSMPLSEQWPLDPPAAEYPSAPPPKYSQTGQDSPAPPPYSTVPTHH